MARSTMTYRFPRTPCLLTRAASYILDRVAEHKGIIPVPEQPGTNLWKAYVLGQKEVEDYLLQLAHDRRVLYETKGTYF